jgi:hypothetical protein
VIPLGFKREYYKELVYGGELFINRDDFIATSEFSGKVDLLYLKRFDVSKYPGIYVIYNNEFLYTGQSATGIINRLADHQSKVKKAHLMKEGRILFFGRTDGSIGKDQLDYIEKFLIGLFKAGRRETVNDTIGNNSYCSNEHRIIAEYLVEFVYHAAFSSKSNPFRENEIVNAKRAGGEADIFDWSKMAELFRDYDHVKAEKDLHARARKEFKDLVYVEYEGPNDSKIVSKAIEKIGPSDSFYLETRDGDWPTLPQEAERFERNLLRNYQKHKRILQKSMNLQNRKRTHDSKHTKKNTV